LPEPQVVVGAPLGFRTRARLAVRGRASSPKLGLFQEGTHRIADIPRCRIQHPVVNEIAAALRRAIRETGVAPYADRSQRGDAHTCRSPPSATSRAQVVLVGTRAPDLLRRRLERSRELGARLQDCGGTEIGSARMRSGRTGIISRVRPGRRSPASTCSIHALGQSHAELFETLTCRAREAVPTARACSSHLAGTGAIAGLPGRAARGANEISGTAARAALGIAARLPMERARAEVRLATRRCSADWSEMRGVLVAPAQRPDPRSPTPSARTRRRDLSRELRLDAFLREASVGSTPRARARAVGRTPFLHRARRDAYGLALRAVETLRRDEPAAPELPLDGMRARIGGAPAASPRAGSRAAAPTGPQRDPNALTADEAFCSGKAASRSTRATRSRSRLIRRGQEPGACRARPSSFEPRREAFL
jgi:hypothetical protein